MRKRKLKGFFKETVGDAGSIACGSVAFSCTVAAGGSLLVGAGYGLVAGLIAVAVLMIKFMLSFAGMSDDAQDEYDKMYGQDE